VVPFDVKINGKKVGISWESLAWFFVVTAAATVIGELIYDKWVSPYLADLPSLPGANNSAPVSVQTPSAMGRVR
jgi:hypothetical protein